MAYRKTILSYTLHVIKNTIFSITLYKSLKILIAKHLTALLLVTMHGCLIAMIYTHIVYVLSHSTLINQILLHTITNYSYS